MKKIIFSKFFWAMLVVWLGITYFSFVYITQPIIIQACVKYRALKDKEKEVTSLKERRDLLADLKVKEGELAELYDLALQYLPNAREEGSFILQVKSNASQTGQTLTSITVQEKSKGKSKKPSASDEESSGAKDDKNSDEQSRQEKYPYTMSISGGWESIILFLENLENYSRLNQIDSLSFSMSSEGILATSIQGTIFSEKEEKLESSAENIKISDEQIKKLNGLANFTPIVNFSEGIGRDNPFMPY